MQVIANKPYTSKMIKITIEKVLRKVKMSKLPAPRKFNCLKEVQNGIFLPQYLPHPHGH